MFAHVLWVVGTLFYRFFVVQISFFQGAVIKAPWKNFFTGWLSDWMVTVAFLGIYFIFFSILKKFKKNKKLTSTLSWLSIIFCVASIFFYASCLRYIEHFGKGFGLKQTHYLNGFDPYMGLLMLISSKLTMQYVGLVSFSSFVIYFFLRFKNKAISRLKEKPLITALVCLIFAVSLNSWHIHIKGNGKIHHDLRYHPILDVYYANKNSRQAIFTENDREKIDYALLHKAFLSTGNRIFETSDKSPLEQSAIYEPQDSPIYKTLQTKIQKKAQEKGPFHIFVVIMESFRAKNVGFMNPAEKKDLDLTPKLNKLSSNALIFENIIGAGMQTSIGQVGINCSQYSFPRFSFMIEGYHKKIKCLPDLFHEKSYATSFIYSANNSFDNQHSFYATHHTDIIIGEEDFHKDEPKSGWGYSDLSMFKKALLTLQNTPQDKPFFSIILTLSNHAPYKLPSDAPLELINSQEDIERKLFRYADFSFAYFYEQIKIHFPHSIILMVADHGKVWGEQISESISYNDLYETARIPAMIFIPELEKDLEGLRINTLASQVDLAPTLLGLIGMNNEKNTFLGQNIFARKGPFYHNFYDRVVQVEQKENAVVVTPINPQVQFQYELSSYFAPDYGPIPKL